MVCVSQLHSLTPFSLSRYSCPYSDLLLEIHHFPPYTDEAHEFSLFMKKKQTTQIEDLFTIVSIANCGDRGEDGQEPT